MKISRMMSLLALVMFSAAPVLAETGDLKIHFEYGGEAFDPGPVDVNKDVEFCGKFGLINERLLVNKENKGIKNVVVYVYTGRGGSKLDKQKPANNTHTLANKNCRFEPRIVIAQAGDKLDITNPDAVGHNANLGFFNNKQENLTVAPGQKVTIDLAKEEPAPIPVACNIHPWMQARVAVFEHPFAAVSDDNGDLLIKGLPAGEELVFRVYHEAGGISDVTVDGKKTEWSRSRFEVDVKPGMNDLGTVVIPGDALSAD